MSSDHIWSYPFLQNETSRSKTTDHCSRSSSKASVSWHQNCPFYYMIRKDGSMECKIKFTVVSFELWHTHAVDLWASIQQTSVQSHSSALFCSCSTTVLCYCLSQILATQLNWKWGRWALKIMVTLKGNESASLCVPSFTFNSRKTANGADSLCFCYSHTLRGKLNAVTALEQVPYSR